MWVKSLFAFLIGAFFHVIAKWMQWKTIDKERKLFGYWKEYTPLVVLGFILDIFLMFPLWYFGLLDTIIVGFVNWMVNTASALLNVEVTKVAMEKLPDHILMDVGAGFILDSLSKNIFAKLLRKLGVL